MARTDARRTKYGVSPWLDELPRKRRIELGRVRGAQSIPVVIIGGGLTGCFTAYALAAAGVKVLLLEADRIGAAGAARSPGVLQGEPSASFRDLDAAHGRKAARAMFELSRRAVLDLTSTARRLGIKAGLDTADALRLFVRYGANEKAVSREATARRDAGLDAVWLKAATAIRESRVDEAAGAVKLHDWGRSDPVRLTLGFAAAAMKRGAVLHERSPAHRIKARRRDVQVHVQGGIITAETVIVCTGEPTDLFRSLKRHVRAEETYGVLTERIPAAIRKQLVSTDRIVTDSAQPPHIIRWVDGDRLLVTGAAQERTAARGRDRILVQRTGQLMYETLRLYPALSGIAPAYGWDIPIGVTADNAMYAGAHRNYPRHLFAWATRHDPAQAFLASRILLRHVLGQSERDDVYFAFTRG
jgi:gamma-glutamylputrescine oxidase